MTTAFYSVPGYRKLSPTELEAAGLSRKSERYQSPTGELISKRQFQKIQRGGQTYTEFKKSVAKGEKQKSTLTAKASAGKRAKALARKTGKEKTRKSRKGFLGDTYTYANLGELIDDSIYLTSLSNSFQIMIIYSDADGNITDHGVSFYAESVEKFIMAIENIYKTLSAKYNFSEIEKIDLIVKEPRN